MEGQGYILVVDDSFETRKLLSLILADEGYLVRIAEDGKEALTAIAEKLPDLILLDVVMPQVDGFEVMKNLKEQKISRAIPIILLSALSDTERQLEGLKLGAVDFITKPFKTEELLVRVGTHIELRRLRQQLEQRAVELQKMNEQLTIDITEREKAEEEREKLIIQLQQAMHSIKTLQGLIPICANCKKVRDDKGYWSQVEEYLSKYTNAEFSHGLCPQCAKELYPDYYSSEKK